MQQHVVPALGCLLPGERTRCRCQCCPTARPKACSPVDAAQRVQLRGQLGRDLRSRGNETQAGMLRAIGRTFNRRIGALCSSNKASAKNDTACYACFALLSAHIKLHSTHVTSAACNSCLPAPHHTRGMSLQRRLSQQAGHADQYHSACKPLAYSPAQHRTQR